jgi:hypothetical protein
VVTLNGLRLNDEREGHQPQHVAIDIVVALDENDGAFLCAFTLPRPTWVLPQEGEPGDADSLASAMGWRCSFDPKDRYEASVREVLESVWSRWGIHPYAWGQVVVRPRSVSGRVAHDQSGFRYGPPKPSWIVEIRGVQYDTGAAQYYSGYLMLFSDPDLIAVSGFLH